MVSVETLQQNEDFRQRLLAIKNRRQLLQTRFIDKPALAGTDITSLSRAVFILATRNIRPPESLAADKLGNLFAEYEWYGNYLEALVALIRFIQGEVKQEHLRPRDLHSLAPLNKIDMNDWLGADVQGEVIESMESFWSGPLPGPLNDDWPDWGLIPDNVYVKIDELASWAQENGIENAEEVRRLFGFKDGGLPKLWSTLDEAADYLAENIGEKVDVQQVITACAKLPSSMLPLQAEAVITKQLYYLEHAGSRKQKPKTEHVPINLLVGNLDELLKDGHTQARNSKKLSELVTVTIAQVRLPRSAVMELIGRLAGVENKIETVAACTSASAESSSPSAGLDKAKHQPTKQRRRDAIQIEIEDIVAKDKNWSTATVMAALQKHAGEQGSCVFDRAADGNGVVWDRAGGGSETLTIRRLEKRLSRIKKRS